MKTITELEESDINLKENKLHSIVSMGILIGSLIMVPTNSDPATDPEHEKHIRKGVATFLNLLSNQGFSITKNEDIPEAFRF